MMDGLVTPTDSNLKLDGSVNGRKFKLMQQTNGTYIDYIELKDGEYKLFVNDLRDCFHDKRKGLLERMTEDYKGGIYNCYINTADWIAYDLRYPDPVKDFGIALELAKGLTQKVNELIYE